MTIRGHDVSPLTSGIIIVVTLLIVGFLLWRYTGSPPRGSGMTDAMKGKMQNMFGSHAPGETTSGGNTPAASSGNSSNH